jgi:hypothetical protein
MQTVSPPPKYIHIQINNSTPSSDRKAKCQFLFIKGFTDFYSTLIIYRGNGPK